MTDLPAIPFNRPATVGTELDYVAEAFRRGHTSGNGHFSRQAEELLKGISGSPDVLLTTNCSHALELSARILGFGPGDEVIVPAYTFVTTASAIALTGATPVFADVCDATLNLDPESTASLLNDRTKAVFTVHYAGIADGVDELVHLCRGRGIPLIEDNAHGLGATFQGQKLGTFGAMSTLSFHETKNISCGEGGALAINEHEHVALAEILREKGTDRARFLRGQVDKYTWVEIGSSWVQSDLLAAVLVAQLERFEDIQRRRRHIWDTYAANLGEWATDNGVRLPFVPSASEHSSHMYFLRFDGLEKRTRFIDFMKSRGIMAVFHYQALNTSTVGRRFGGRDGQCQIAEDAAETLVRLPIFADMREDELQRVVDAVLEFET